MFLMVPVVALLCNMVLMTGVSEIEVPQEIIEITDEVGGKYAICPELLQTICYTESRFQTDAYNSGCYGVMQINPRWHQERMDKLGVTNICDMGSNILVGTDYLAELLREYGDIEVALMVYHGEQNAVERVRNGQTSGYAEEILQISANLERIHGK
ncbi:MAG: lytic transglycosylase domain-containing protein [Bacteroidales bacterium]|nr:lytic transglycosylase domain-containing protein [Lachnoclostridium sp.]MCM1385272.1 lytic transglycosylase domain-containing protein [Lachnoclostridium sp.]MCM1466142.1 lytic transglycosylase domain-containing protein [Bacteroidales bacterium]